jgi:peptide-methionine (S)-S-oxide reductase
VKTKFFGGVHDLLRRYAGVISTRVGYAGGEVPNATYRNHRNHAELLRLFSIRRPLAFENCWNSVFQIDVVPPGHRPESELPIGHLLY